MKLLSKVPQEDTQVSGWIIKFENVKKNAVNVDQLVRGQFLNASGFCLNTLKLVIKKSKVQHHNCL